MSELIKTEARNYSEFFSRLIFRVLKDKNITRGELDERLVAHYAKGYPNDLQEAERLAGMASRRLSDENLELYQASDIIAAIGYAFSLNVIVSPEDQPDAPYPALWDEPVEDLHLKGYALGCLQNNGTLYIGQLVGMHYNDLMKIAGIGNSTAHQITFALGRNNLHLSTDTTGWTVPKH